MKNIFITFLVISFIPATAYSFTNAYGTQRIVTAPDTHVKVLHESDIYLTISNFGLIGSLDGLYTDPDWDGTTPGAEFPAGSEIDHLFLGTIWIGAEVDTVDEDGNPAVDTLVSVGHDGWWNVSEIFPPPISEPSLWREDIFGDEEYFSVYLDTLTDPRYVNYDPYDGRGHIPLELRITQNSFCWSTPGYDEVIIIEFALENIGGRDLHNVWFGLYHDGDVFHESESPFGNEQGATDDLCGLVENGPTVIGWLADNDGQPYDGQFQEISPTGVVCIALLGSSEPDLEINFNWWIPNLISELDWGPQLQSNYDRWGPFPGGGLGTPGGDRAKYQVMSNGERDYDQAWAALDHTGEGWIPAVDYADDMANGFETRYLLSFGALDIPTGETDTLTVAYFGVQNLHVDPLNYENNLRYNTSDSMSIAEYYRNLDFSDVIVKSDSALSFYSRGYTAIPYGPPRDFHIDHWAEDHIELRLIPASRPYLTEYRIYRGTEPGVYDPEKITPDGFIDSVFVDTEIENNVTYYYVVSSVSSFNIEGGYSPEVSINSGQPQTPTGLTAESEQVRVDLQWEDGPDSDLLGYNVYRANPNQDFALIGSTETNSYIDYEVYIGRRYRYKIRAVDIYGNESFDSEIVSSYAMGFDSGILLVMANRRDGNPDYDSMAVFYENMLSDCQYLLIDFRPESMPLIASFSTVIFCQEHINGYRYFDLYDNEHLFADYLEAGGNLLLAGTRQVAPSNSFHGAFNFQPVEFPNRYLNLAGVEFPSVFNTEFIGGEAVDGSFYDFSVDTSRANRITFPPVDNDGRLPGIGTIVPIDSSEILYNYVSVEPDTSAYHGRPIGIIHHTQDYNTAVLEFPLYYVQEPTSFHIFRRILEEFGELPVGTDDDDPYLPRVTGLLQNYPNPFNSTTLFDFSLREAGDINLSVYNILGQKVKTLVEGFREAGNHRVEWNADNVPSGIYFARMETDSERKSIKLVLLK